MFCRDPRLFHNPDRFRNVQFQSGGRLLGPGAALLRNLVQFAAHFAFVRAGDQRGFLGNDACFAGFDDRVIEGLPAEARARFDDFVEGFVFRFAVNNRFARSQAAAHDLGDEQTPAADFTHEPLAHDVAQAGGQALADLLFFLARKHAEDAVDRLPGVDRVEGAENDVAGFRRGQSDVQRFAVANFTDQDRFRRLTQSGAQTVGEVREILAELALTDRRFA